MKTEKRLCSIRASTQLIADWAPHINCPLMQNYLAGYEKQKRDIEDTVLLALQRPDIFEKITEGTRIKKE